MPRQPLLLLRRVVLAVHGPHLAAPAPIGWSILPRNRHCREASPLFASSAGVLDLEELTSVLRDFLLKETKVQRPAKVPSPVPVSTSFAKEYQNSWNVQLSVLLNTLRR